jgi:hypothetical protein
MTFFILRMPSRAQYAEIEDEPSGFERSYIVDQGASCLGAIDGTMSVPLTRKHKGMKLDDFISNLFDWLIVTERVKDVLAAECNNVEVYPLEILDQKGKPVKARYFFVHPVGTVDCVDLEKSTFKRNAAFPDKILTFRKLVLDEKRIPGDLKLFRIKEQPETIIIRKDLAQKLADMKAGGFTLWELGAPILL